MNIQSIKQYKVLQQKFLDNINAQKNKSYSEKDGLFNRMSWDSVSKVLTLINIIDNGDGTGTREVITLDATDIKVITGSANVTNLLRDPNDTDSLSVIVEE